MKYIIGALVTMLSLPTLATEYITLKTPRGDEVQVTLHIPSGSKLPALVVAPGKACNSKSALFESIGKLGAAGNMAIVRFEWNYCQSNPANPSEKLKNEIEDFQTVLDFARSHPALDKDKIIIGGKSFGSVIAHKIFANDSLAKGLLLLTPVCSYTSDENDKPLPEPIGVCEENYPGMKLGTRPILMVTGDDDDLCLLPMLYDYLKDSNGNISTFVAGGDHGFYIADPNGNVDQPKTDKNINTVAEVVINWMGLF